MKRLGYFAASVGTLALVLWTATLAIELVEKLHYLPSYLHSSNTGVLLVGSATISNNAAFVADEETDTVPAPHDHPPLRIICGAHIFRVVYASHDWMMRKKQPAYAMSQMDKELIILDRQRTAVEVREDVLHELMHIALWEAGGKLSGLATEEESFIKPAAPSLRDILADNPQLVKWLTKAGG